MANLDLACYCLLLSICNLDSPTGCISFSQSLTTGPVLLKTILAHTGLHKQLLLDIHHDVLLLKRGKKIERKRKRKKERERERERDCSRLTMNLLIGTSHLRLSLRVERRQAPSYLDLPQDQELLNLFLRPSPFTHTTVADPGGGLRGLQPPLVCIMTFNVIYYY